MNNEQTNINEQENTNNLQPINTPDQLNVTPEVLPDEPKKNNKKIASAICIVIILACGAYLLLQQDFMKDRLKAWTFKPSAEVAKVEEKLNLTDDGKLIFHASEPVLEQQDDFNKHCESHEKEISILGCYTNRKIYLYDIKTDELPGVVESTAAHELLHAIWERLSASEQNTIQSKLDQVYKDNFNLLSKDLEIYNASEQDEELYVRAATQIANLPKELEEHYARYFNDQDAVVAYYDSYITPFRKLEKEMEDLEKELKDLGVKIDQETAEYETRANNLSTAVDEFNNCANTVNCFSSQYAFNTRRNELLAEQSAIDALYEQLSSDINSYNQKVEKYNNNLLRTKELENVINSNSDPDEIIK